MSKRRRATVTDVDRRPWVAVVGWTPHEYKTRAGAIARLVDEIEHWVKWARMYDHDALDTLIELRDQIQAATGDADYNFTIAGLSAHAALRRAP